MGPPHPPPAELLHEMKPKDDEQLPSRNTLSATAIPDLQPPVKSQFNYVAPSNVIHTMNITSTFSSANSSPDPANKSHNPWYRVKQNSSDASDDDMNTPKRNALSKERYGLPSEIELAGASTPLQDLKNLGNSSFLSPLNKLDNLHLESQLDLEEQDLLDEADAEDYEHDFSLGDRTITNESDSDADSADDEYALHSSPPQYINIRKRHISDSISDISMNTPDVRSKAIRQVSASTGTPRNSIMTSLRKNMERHIDDFDDMSICSTISANKLSFSQSDSTPCPIQPKRKKLKLKNDSTPSSRSSKYKTVLNLSNSIKTSATSIISQLNYDYENESNDEEIDNVIAGDLQDISAIDAAPDLQSTPQAPTAHSPQYYSQPTPTTSANKISSTPISQSTPANSRSSTPPMTQEYGESINGYKFVKPKVPSPSVPTPSASTQVFSYQTPSNPRVSSELRASYTRNDFTPVNDGKYQIVGEFPVTSAGMMDESEMDLHVGDKRIGDPYLTPKSESASYDSSVIKEEYLYSGEIIKLPLLPPYFSNQTSLTKDEIISLLSSNSNLHEFYKLITDNQTSELEELIKSERIRWHPDKWVGRFDSSDSAVWFDMEIVNLLSQLSNSLMEQIK